jgi:ketosteroid isomerase-like protein
LERDDESASAEIEAIKRLKAQYCRYLDSKDWSAWRRLFTDDFVMDISPAGGRRIEGADEYVEFTRKAVGHCITVHHVHAPEISLTSASTAAGVWALEDILRFGRCVNLRGYGHYAETYDKHNDTWRIKSSTLTRVREDFFNGLFTVYLTPRLRPVIMRLALRGASR